MLKIFLVNAFIVLTAPILAQNDHLSNPNVQLIIACQTSKNIKGTGLGFILKLVNNGYNDLTIPGEFDISPFHLEGNIQYEVFYYNRDIGDSIDITKTVSIHEDGRVNFNADSKMKPGNSVLIEGNISYLFFQRPGTYLIRFTFLASKYNKNSDNISSDWIKVE